MSRNEIISVRNLKKVFDIYDDPADRVKELFSLRKKRYSYQYTALRDINFSINEGEFVGIVGRNGAGKSTLLKILSGKLTASEGTVHVNGSISLLQLGVGFNKELTGLENIKFSAMLLGHTPDKIARIIKEVEAFADIGEFIHHPVKTYSSGMYSRLAFAIGITINPDILIVDEVLSVGDIQFASKCLDKMHELKRNGKTVIIVTHDVDKIAVFCDRAIWLKDSSIEDMGNAKDIIEKYRDDMWMDSKNKQASIPATVTDSDPTPAGLFDRDIEWDDLSILSKIQKDRIKISHAAVYNKTTNRKTTVFSRGDTVQIYLKILSEANFEEISVGWILTDKRGLVAVHSGSTYCGKNIHDITKGQEIICYFDFAMPALKNGEFVFSFGLRNGESIVFKANNVIPAHISNSDHNSTQGGYVILEKASFYY